MRRAHRRARARTKQCKGPYPSLELVLGLCEELSPTAAIHHGVNMRSIMGSPCSHYGVIMGLHGQATREASGTTSMCEERVGVSGRVCER